MGGPLAVLIAYFVGAIPFGYVLVKYTAGKDVRAEGSGNIGATNVLRATGRAMAVATLLLDIGKGYLAVWVADRLTQGSVTQSSVIQSPLTWMCAAALAVMAGHAFPVFLKFKGGKAVASFIGAFLYLTPASLLAILVVFVIVVAVTRHISAGSIIAAGSFPLAVWLIEHPAPVVTVTSIVAAAFIVYRHKSNIERLRAGTESVFAWRKR